MTALFREGDIVTLQGVVRHGQEPGEPTVSVTVNVAKGYREVFAFVDATELAMAKPAIKVGDAVTWMDDGIHILCVGTVLAIDGDWLWVRDNNTGDMETLAVTSCDRVDPDTAPPGPPEMPPPSPLDI